MGGSTGEGLISGCNPDPAVTFNPVEARPQQAAGSRPDLKFDRRYEDFA